MTAATAVKGKKLCALMPKEMSQKTCSNAVKEVKLED